MLVYFYLRGLTIFQNYRTDLNAVIYKIILILPKSFIAFKKCGLNYCYSWNTNFFRTFAYLFSFFYHALVYLIPMTTTWGLFLMECIRCSKDNFIHIKYIASITVSPEHPDTAFQNCCFFVYRLVRNGDRRYYHIVLQFR